MTGDPTHAFGPDQPGSHGEHLLQRLFGTDDRAAGFYDRQVLDHLNERMREFIGRQEMAFVATSDAQGECDCTFRAGPPGFIQVVDERTIAYPEYRGNGVMASLGNIMENAHIGVLMVDFFEDLVGLHVNGRARIVTPGMAKEFGLIDDGSGPAGRRAERWVTVSVEEAYIHCSKNIPLLSSEDRRARVADHSVRPAGSGYFTGARGRGPENTVAAADQSAPEPASVPSTQIQDVPVPNVPGVRSAAEAESAPRSAHGAPVGPSQGGSSQGNSPQGAFPTGEAGRRLEQDAERHPRVSAGRQGVPR